METKLEPNEIIEMKRYLYLSSQMRDFDPANVYPQLLLRKLTFLFNELYVREIIKRGQKVIQHSDNEKKVLRYAFEWAILSPDFKGDLKKGLMLVGNQGFGKDVILRTIVEFYKIFDRKFTEYTYFEFATKWFEGFPAQFLMPIKITDVYDNGKLKREKQSIPFLELLDYREQINQRRGLLASTNHPPEELQKALESDKTEKRLYERIKECFNVAIITAEDSKRVANFVTF